MAETKLDLASMVREAREGVDTFDAKDKEQPEKKPTPREITISISYPKPGSGQLLQAAVTSRVMSRDERRVVQRLEVMLAGGLEVSALSVVAQNRNRALAICSTQLREPPPWLTDSLAEDDVLLFSIYAALEGHENAYFFRDGGQGEDAATARRLVVSSPLDPQPPAQQ